MCEEDQGCVDWVCLRKTKAAWTGCVLGRQRLSRLGVCVRKIKAVWTGCVAILAKSV